MLLVASAAASALWGGGVGAGSRRSHQASFLPWTLGSQLCQDPLHSHQGGEVTAHPPLVGIRGQHLLRACCVPDLMLGPYVSLYSPATL